jgi:predicted flap endonuclease-1-like 5' DNA nuclease
MPLESVSPPVVPVPLPSQRMKQVDIPEDMPYDPAVGTSMGQAETSTPASVPASAPAGTVSLGMSDAGDLEEWKRLAKDVQAQLQEADGALAGLRGELAAVKGWQAKTPSLVRLGQSLATLPPHKVAAADAAIGAGCFPTVSADCQDLSIIDGIGETYEQRLYAAGIGTFWELAYLSDTALKEILRLSDWQMRSIDFADIRLQAQQLAIDTNAKGLLWDGETPDDFARIKGIGKVYEQRLYERGILTYRALATEKVETLNAILGPQVFPAQIEQWIRQAAALAAEQET